MEKRQKERSLADILLIIPAIVFAVFFILQAWSFVLHSDDLWVLQYCNSGDLFSDFSFWWHHNNGRYSSALFQLIFFRFPQPAIAISSAIFVLGINFLTVRMLLLTLINKGFLQTKNIVLFSVLATAAIYFSSPDVLDVFFWPSSVFVHGLSVAAMLSIAAFLLKPGLTGFIISIVSAVFLGGASETAAFLSIFMLIGGIFIIKTNPVQTIALLIILLTGMIIHYFAPASQIRSDELIDAAPQGFSRAMAVVVYHDVQRLIVSFAVATLMIFTFSGIQTGLLHKKLKPGIAFLFPLSATITYLVFIAYVMRDAEPARALQPLVLIFLIPAMYVSRFVDKLNPVFRIMPAILLTCYFLLAGIFSV